MLGSPFSSITDREVVRRALAGIDAVLHAATLHKPHIATHSRQNFVEVNITGTLNLLEEAVAAGVRAFIFTSTTSVFGDALTPPPDSPAAWIDESVVPVPKNIYGVTKAAAEDLCQLFSRNQSLPCIVPRTSRFFPEDDDSKAVREAYADENAKTNEFLHRRVEIEDVVSATTPFRREDLAGLRHDAAAVLRRRVPAYAAEYARRSWRMTPAIDRVYVNERALRELGWQPRHDFAAVVARLAAGGELASPLARLIGAKGCHAGSFAEGPYPVA